MLLTTFLIFVWVGLACAADVLFKNTAGFGDIKFLYGLGLYMATGFLALVTFKRIEFGSMTILWIAMSLFAGLLVSVFYYHEKFTPVTAVAALLTLVVVVLIGTKQ